MMALNCPSCRRALNLPDHLQGSWVKCPACQQTFQAPATVIEAQVAPVAEPVAEQVPEVARPDPAAEAFNFESEQGGYLRVRVEARIRSAVNSLNAMIVLDGIIGLVCCFVGSVQN